MTMARILGLMKIGIAAVATGAILSPARGAPPPDADPSLSAWFQSLVQPGTGISCCSAADCRITRYRVSDGHYEALIDERYGAAGARWEPVPPNRILRKVGNPTGAAVACWTRETGVLCFVLPPEA